MGTPARGPEDRPLLLTGPPLSLQLLQATPCVSGRPALLRVLPLAAGRPVHLCLRRQGCISLFVIHVHLNSQTLKSPRKHS